MTTTDDFASTIAHRRKRAAELALAQDQAPGIVIWAAFYAELLSRMAAGEGYVEALTATGIVDDPAMQRAWPWVRENPLHVRAAQRVIEGSWPWIVGDEPMPANVNAGRTPEAVELELLAIAAYTPAPVLLTESAGGAA